MAEELHSEFILAVLEVKDNRLVKAKEEGYLEVFCVGIIYNLWGMRKRIKNRSNGATNNLHELTSTHLYADIEVEESEPYNKEKDMAIDKALELIEASKQSEDPSERFRARIFHHSVFTFKNPKQFSNSSKIPYQGVVIPNYKAYKEKLRELCSML